MIVGLCTCPQGIDGSHQAAVAIQASVNSIPTLAPKIRQIYAQIALGGKADKNPAFYAGLLNNTMEVDTFNPDFTSPPRDLI